MNARNIFSIIFIFGILVAGCDGSPPLVDTEIDDNRFGPSTNNNGDGNNAGGSGNTTGNNNNTNNGDGNIIIDGDGNIINIGGSPNASTIYAVNFNPNGGSGNPPDPQQGAPGSPIYLPNGNGLSKTGFIFGGWNTNAAGTGTNHNVGSPFTVPNTNITLYAMWTINGTPQTYTVTFNANGGNGNPPGPQRVISGDRIILPSGSSLTRTGFTFEGWNTNSSGTGINYIAGSTYMPTGNITLYTKWDAHLPAPTGVIATAEAGLRIRVTWTPMSGATSYDVYYEIGSSTTKTLITNNRSPDSAFYVHALLQSGTVYRYYIKAKNSAGIESNFSSPASATAKSR
jgi:uncharacterized repeat protein (TIGR02543 family)